MRPFSYFGFRTSAFSTCPMYFPVRLAGGKGTAGVHSLQMWNTRWKAYYYTLQAFYPEVTLLKTIEVYNTAWSTAQGACETLSVIIVEIVQNTVILTVMVFQGSTAKGKGDIWLARVRQYTDGRTYWKSKSSYIEYSSSNSANESGLFHLSLSTIVRKSTTTGKKQPWMVSDTLQVHKIKI